MSPYLIVLLSLIRNCYKAKEIFMNISYLVDDKLIILTQGTEEYLLPDSNHLSEATHDFKGKIGDLATIILYNITHGAYFAVIMTIGTTIITTAQMEYWQPLPSGFNQFINKQYRTVKGQQIEVIGNDTPLNYHNYTFYFSSPQDQTYCSTKTTDGKNAISYTHKDKVILIDIDKMVFPIETYDTYIKVTSTIQGVLSNDESLIILNQPFLLGRLTYQYNDYMTDVVDYICISNNHPSQPCQYTIAVCYERCKTCQINNISPPSLDDQQCVLCDDTAGYAPIQSNPSNCLLINDPNNKLVYDSSSNEFICHASCVRCEYIPSSNHCKCNNLTDYVLEGATQSECFKAIDYPDHFADLDGILKKCFVTCAKCTGKGNEYSHQCIECKSPLILDTNNNCLCRGYNIYDEFGDFKCLDECPDGLYHIPGLKLCVDKCPPNYPLIDNYSCVTVCPPNTFQYKNKCMTDCFPQTINNDLFIHINHYAKECIDYINHNILDYYELHRYIEGIDFSLQVFDLNQPIKEKKNLTSIDFTDCQKTLRKHYEIPLTDSILIAKFDLYRNQSSSINQIEYNAYTHNGKLLDISICYQTKINVSYPILKHSVINFTYTHEFFTNTSIDILNAMHPLYNDYCFPFHINGSDMILADRRKNIYINVSLCEDTCNYTRFDYQSRKAQCSCLTKPRLSLDPTGFLIQQFTTELPNTHLVISKCNHILLTWNYIKTNIPFYIFGIIILIQITLVIVHFINGDSQVYVFLLSYESLFRKRQPIKSRINESIHNPQLNSMIKEINQEDKLKRKLKKSIYQRSIFNNKHKNFWRMFLNIILEKYPLFRLFYEKQLQHFWTINVSRLLLYFLLPFVINTMFFTDNMISYKYINTNFNIVSIFISSVYTSIISVMIFSLMNQLLHFHQKFFSQLHQDIKQHKSTYSYGQHKAKLMNALLIVYWVFCISCSIWCWYYCTIFNVVYEKTQKMKVFSWLWSIGNMFILFSMVACVISLMKYYSLISCSEWLFRITESVQKWI